MHVGDTVTEADGSYQLDDFGELNGLFLVTASGGSFTDLMSGETVALDPADQVRTLMTLDLFEQRTDALVSPVGHLIESLARSRLASGLHANLYDARAFAAEHVDAHFGGLDWQRIDPAPLDEPASSATDAVRAALIASAFSVLTDDIAVAAGASHQEVNAYALTEAWGRDLAAPPFDGQDGNDRTNGSGLQLGECPSVPVDCVPFPPAPACSLGSCRSACDLFAGTPRAALSGALLKLVRSSQLNQTGLTDSALLPLARAMSDNQDEVLFAGSCVDALDRTPPTLLFEAPSPDDGAHVRDTISVRVRAVDDIDVDPDLVFLGGLTDSDGDPTNAVATATIATTTDGPLIVAAEATDSAGNMAMTSRTFVVDNTDPILAVDPAGYFVSGTDWWTGDDSPDVTGSITETNLVSIKVFAGAIEVTQATVTGSSWTATLPVGAVSGVAGEDIRFEATDRAGNVVSVVQRIRYDATPPLIAAPSSTVRDERSDVVTFSDSIVEPIFGGPSFNPTHTHASSGGAVLGPPSACDASAPTVYKYAYLLDETPPYVTEAGGPATGGRNPLAWQASITDDGVGVDYSTVAYRIRDVAAGTFPLDWQALSGSGSYTIPLYRTTSSGTSIPVLGTKEGLFELQLRGRDRLGREVTLARCWNHRLLAAPIYLGAAADAVNGPDGSDKYALNSLRLEDTVAPLDPVSMMMNVLGAGQVGGAGLMQYLVVNPTNEPIYLSIDLDNPTSGMFTNTFYQDYWSYSETSSSTNCGIDLTDGGPDESLPNCAFVANPSSGPPSPTTTNGTIPASTSYSIRFWEVATITNAHTEVIPCAGCSTTPMLPATQTRVTVLIPPRGVDVTPLPPRRFLVMPVLKPLAQLQPSGAPPYTEVATGSSITVSGKNDETRSGCHAYTQVSPTRWNCTTRRTYRRVRFAKQLAATGFGLVRSFARTSWSTTGQFDPPHLPSFGNRRTHDGPDWNTSEPTNPPTP